MFATRDTLTVRLPTGTEPRDWLVLQLLQFLDPFAIVSSEIFSVVIGFVILLGFILLGFTPATPSLEEATRNPAHGSTNLAPFRVDERPAIFVGLALGLGIWLVKHKRRRVAEAQTKASEAIP